MNPPTRPCVTCRQPHHQGPDGWYADNGHGRHPCAPPTEPGAAGVPATPTPSANAGGWTPALFGMLARCPRCAGLVDNRRRDIDLHDKSHEGSHAP